MAAINWNSVGKRYYSSGLDRVVLYTLGNPGIPWHSLYSVEESPTGGDPTPYYLDGYKHLQLSSHEEFEATIHALGIPDEFLPCDGTQSLAPGLYSSQQARSEFGLCYRTLVGSDTQSLGTWYKINIIYNALASPTTKSKSTLHDTPSLEFYSWSIQTRGKRFPGQKPIAHLVIDSRKADPILLAEVESYLYGSEGIDPVLLDPDQLAVILSGEDFEIEDEE